MIREEEIEQFFLSTLLAKVKEVNLTIQKGKPKDTAPLKRKLDKLTDLYLSDLIDREKYEREYTATKRELDEAEAVQKPIDTAQVMSLLDAYQTLSREAKKAFWLRIIKKATVSKGKIDYTLCYTK